ncbi:MAG: CBS domain-containing protein [Candidatus Devosia symbiotica]|nr:CBS domain-containing protein [Candidatus Devosia symbiotica]
MDHGTEKLAKFTVTAVATIGEVLKRIDANKSGIVFLVDKASRVIGAITDGDIRRRLLVNSTLEDAIASCVNHHFVSASQGADRESILKLLDDRIHTVPILDADGRLVDVYSRERFRLEEEQEIFSRARAPARISFGGGGTDMTRYFSQNGGAVINATITLYAHATLRRRSDRSVRLYSHDLREVVDAASVGDLAFDGHLDLLKSAVKLIDPPYGFELEVAADFPVGSGLGGSAVVTTAIIGCFNEFRSDHWNRHQIAEMAFQSERLMLNIPGGWQDQYATVFGGFNYMEFTADDNEVMPLRLHRDVLRELEESMVLLHTGQNRSAEFVHDEQARRSVIQSTEDAARRLKEITQEMKKCLLRGRLAGYGELLNDAWDAKRALSPAIASSSFDEIYSFAIRCGAVGGKLLGAGGGGYFVFFVKPFKRMKFLTAMEEHGYHCMRLYFDDCGLQSWRVRVPD